MHFTHNQHIFNTDCWENSSQFSSFFCKMQQCGKKTKKNTVLGSNIRDPHSKEHYWTTVPLAYTLTKKRELNTQKMACNCK